MSWNKSNKLFANEFLFNKEIIGIILKLTTRCGTQITQTAFN